MPLADITTNQYPIPFRELPLVWRTCLDLAWEAHRAGSLPIAAVVTDAEGIIIARGRNRLAEREESSPHLIGTPYLTGSPLAHAEVNALLELGYRPPGPRPILFTTTEPCPLCMGAARMSGVERVSYASRDPWAGCASMSEEVPYLQRSGPKAEGPQPLLEAPLVAWQAAVHLISYPDSSHFLDIWNDCLPEACAAGRKLFESGTLTALADDGATTAEVWEVLQGILSN